MAEARGQIRLHLVRQFIGRPGIFKRVDWLADHKMNRLHFHLTDVHGWRLDDKKWPRLTGLGAWANLGGAGLLTGDQSAGARAAQLTRRACQPV